MDQSQIKNAESYPLSDDDIRTLLGGDIKITSYSDLSKMHSINELFDRKGRAILFFPQENEQQGHWCCLIKDGRQIEFTDPYGEPPDAQKDNLSAGKLASMGMDKPDLTRLLEDSGCRVIYNKIALQEESNNVQTCGRHCVCRLLYYKMPIAKYRQMVARSGDTPDEFSVKQTFRVLGK